MYHLKPILILLLITVCASSYAQTVNLIDKKGTIKNINLDIGNIAEIYDATGGQTINEGTFSDIEFGTTGIIDNSDFTTTSNSISILKAGRYEITYRTSTETTNNQRNGGEFFLEINGTEASGTRAYTYNRNNLVDKNTVTVCKIIQINTETTIKIKGQVYASNQGGTSSSLNMVANGSSLIVKRIK
ncbi:hypothetical protein [Thalassobellus citreus]|uniref:hypothetical protein n=1 Tax=Thalassobellus citreus TaxID=3367752 RepID=UPI0037974270